MSEFHSHLVVNLVGHTETNIPIQSVPVAFKYPMIRSSAIHTAYRIFAAFFIVMGA
jgi:hypothetical protein